VEIRSGERLELECSVLEMTDYCEEMVVESKCRGIPRKAEVALVVPGGLSPWIITTFGTTRVVGRQPLPHFQRLSRPQGFVGRNHEKNPK